MDVNARTLKSLEWERLKNYLSAECSTVCSRELCAGLETSDEVVLIDLLLKETAEGLKLLQLGTDLCQEGLADLREQLQRLSTGAALSASELLDLMRMLEMSRRLKIVLHNLEADEFPVLRRFLARVHVFDELVSAIVEVVDESGGIRDDASPALRKMRREVHRLNSQVKDELSKIINSPTYSKCLQEPIYTVRNGRHVLPVLANMRHSIEGIVHDSSSTGLTIFVEPKSVLELTNTIRVNEAEIEREIERLLWQLSILAGKSCVQIEESFNVLVEADFIAAKSRLARKYNGSMPKISSSSQIKLLQARHPLLVLQSSLDKVIPNDIVLDHELRTLIITGPNTGGKTVFLKTAGLLSLMMKAGLLLPVSDGSELAVFKSVFADIGDEQSLEQNLSTFSSHMSNIVEITRAASDSTLVLLDEIGAGTDPREGVILARVILGHLTRSGALTICSTHYGDLKTLAHSQTAYANASMDFDDKTMTPSYRLRPGVAGNSKAIAVAARLGLAQDLVAEAQLKLESEKEDFEFKIDELERRLRSVSEREEELAKTKAEMSKRETELKDKTKMLEEEHRRSKQEAANQFQDDYQRAKKTINELTANLQKTPSLARAQQAKEKLDSIKKALDWLDPEEFAAEKQKLVPGQTVKVRSLGQFGVLELLPENDGDKAQVRVGRMKVKVAVSDLELSQSVQKQKNKVPIKGTASPKHQNRSVTPNDPVFVRSERNTLDLRGQRVDEGLALLERFVDEAYLEQMSPLMVIHGHGTGAMKAAVRDFLRGCSYKNKSRPGEPYEGGDGVTVINFA